MLDGIRKNESINYIVMVVLLISPKIVFVTSHMISIPLIQQFILICEWSVI